MVILYLGEDRSIIIDHKNQTYKFYADNLIPNQDYSQIDYSLEKCKNYEVDDLKRLAKISNYKEIK